MLIHAGLGRVVKILGYGTTVPTTDPRYADLALRYAFPASAYERARMVLDDLVERRLLSADDAEAIDGRMEDAAWLAEVCGTSPASVVYTLAVAVRGLSPSLPVEGASPPGG